MINFAEIKIEARDLQLIREIALRTSRLCRALGVTYSVLDAMMDLQVVHDRVGLRLGELLAAPGSDFNHDVLGIRSHLNRETGELEGCFLPRLAKER
jgi:hypothetical protein